MYGVVAQLTVDSPPPGKHLHSNLYYFFALIEKLLYNSLCMSRKSLRGIGIYSAAIKARPLIFLVNISIIIRHILVNNNHKKNLALIAAK